MRIAATSDLHGDLPPIDKSAELIIIAGDICPIYNHSLTFQREWIKATFVPYLKKLDWCPVILIGGNHDFIAQDDREFMDSLPCLYLEDSLSILERKGRDLLVWGTPWTPWCGPWAFMEDERTLDDKFRKIPKDIDILVSHGPPFGFCDRAARNTKSGVHVGSFSLLGHIARTRPHTVICGHIHEDHGKVGRIPWKSNSSGFTFVRNVSRMDEAYDPLNKVIYVEYPDA